MSEIGIDLSALRISANRRHVTMVMAIDKSWSMSTADGLLRKTTRMRAATKGACRVVDALGNGDHAAVLSFGSEIENVSNGLVEISPTNKHGLKRKISSLTPSGSTKLYDTIIVGCDTVLKIAGVLKGLGQVVQEDAGTFWLVILTDGEDVGSSSSLADAKAILAIINSRLGPGVMKAAFIGVKLSAGPRQILQGLARAGGSMATFIDAQNIEDVTRAFDEIALEIETARLRVSSTIDDSSTWPGAIQRGMHVRCVGQSRGAGGVGLGDVGVVKARDSDGDYFIDFPKRDNWCGRPCDIVIDTDAEKVRPGALVKVKSSVTSPTYGWEQYRQGMHGLVVKVEHDGIVYVQCGFDPETGPLGGLWKSQLQEIEVADNGNFAGSHRGSWPGKLQLGQAVRVPLKLSSSSTRWGSLKRGEIGYVRGYKPGSRSYVCDFPSVDGWQGYSQDLEVEAVATIIRPGKQVRVRKGITPSRGWGSASQSSVGVVVSIRYDGGEVVVNFPEDPTWKGSLADLETLDRPPSERLTSIVDGETDCVGSHGLKPLYTDQQDCKICDFCGKCSGAPGSLMYSCKECDCDACVKCYKGKAQLYPDGSTVQIKGFSSPQAAPLNGKLARVIAKDGDRYTVELLSGDNQWKKLKGENLMLPRRKEEEQKFPEGTAVQQKFPDGTAVQIKGFASEQGAPLNGKLGRVITKEGDRYTVELLGGDNARKKVKEDNLMVPRQKHKDGTLVALRGVRTDPGLNGKIGKVVGFNPNKGRYTVAYMDRRLLLLSDNFEVLPDAEEVD